MSTTEQELDSFTQFAKARLRGGGLSLLDELFDLWRAENPSETDYAEDEAAIAGAIEDFRRGDRGRPAGELSRELRQELGVHLPLPCQSLVPVWRGTFRGTNT